MGYVIFECTAPGCSGQTGHRVRDIDAEVFERCHGMYDTEREHRLRKIGEDDGPSSPGT